VDTAGIGVQLGTTLEPLVRQQLKDAGNLEILSYVVSLGFPMTLISLAGVLIKVLAYGRAFELLIYIAVAPLPCAFLPVEDGPGSQITRHFFLNFAAVVLQGLFILISLRLFAAFCDSVVAVQIADDTASLTAMMGQMLLGTLVLLVLVFKSGSLAKTVLNAA
jgi:hypothetical protein